MYQWRERLTVGYIRRRHPAPKSSSCKTLPSVSVAPVVARRVENGHAGFAKRHIDARAPQPIALPPLGATPLLPRGDVTLVPVVVYSDRRTSRYPPGLDIKWRTLIDIISCFQRPPMFSYRQSIGKVFFVSRCLFPAKATVPANTLASSIFRIGGSDRIARGTCTNQSIES
jgi:hypothetical protein